MLDLVGGSVVVMTIAAGVAQLLAFFLPPYGWSLARRAVVFGVWALLAFLALIAFILWNYCEHNCPKDLNWPTAGIALGMFLADAGALWLVSYEVRPLFRRAAADAPAPPAPTAPLSPPRS